MPGRRGPRAGVGSPGRRRPIRTYLELPNRYHEPLPPELAGDDVRFPVEFVRHFVDLYSAPGELVFDPFAGFGTTLEVAEQMGRRAGGVEYDQERCAYARSRLRDPAALVRGDSRRMAHYDLPPIDLCLTSVPYTHQADHTDPLSAYSIPGQGYDAYLDGLKIIFRQVGQLLTSNGRVVIEVANLKKPTGVVTLAWDVARAVGEVLRFEGETIVGWQPTYGYGYDHSYCLLFTRGPEQAVDARLERALQAGARRRGISVNKVVLGALEDATGVRVPPNAPADDRVRFDDLDHLAGTWSTAEADELDVHLRSARQVDPELWQ